MNHSKKTAFKYDYVCQASNYYFFDDLINIEDFDSNLLELDKKSYKNINIYYIGYITMKDSDYVKVKSVNLLYLIVSEVDGYIKEKTRINT